MTDGKRELCGAWSGQADGSGWSRVTCSQPKGHDRGPTATDHVAVVVWSKETQRG
jgi:hypothetical protein